MEYIYVVMNHLGGFFTFYEEPPLIFDKKVFKIKIKNRDSKHINLMIKINSHGFNDYDLYYIKESSESSFINKFFKHHKEISEDWSSMSKKENEIYLCSNDDKWILYKNIPLIYVKVGFN
jgi:hypothetical protein